MILQKKLPKTDIKMNTFSMYNKFAMNTREFSADI